MRQHVDTRESAAGQTRPNKEAGTKSAVLSKGDGRPNKLLRWATVGWTLTEWAPRMGGQTDTASKRPGGRCGWAVGLTVGGETERRLYIGNGNACLYRPACAGTKATGHGLVGGHRKRISSGYRTGAPWTGGATAREKLNRTRFTKSSRVEEGRCCSGH